MELNVLQNGSESDGVKDFWLFLTSEVDTLRVASSLDVEDTIIGPAMLIISDQLTSWVGA